MIASREHLKAVPLFSELSDSELDLILRSSRVVSYPKENVVFNEGDSGDSFFVVLSGRVRVVLLGKNGQELILAILERSSFFGEMALLDAAPRSATVITLAKTEFIRVSREQFLTLLREHRDLVMKIVRHLALRLRDTNDQIRSLSMFDVYGKILHCLVKLGGQRGIRQKNGLLLQPRPSNHELGNMIGCSRETVSRAMKVLQHTGYVTYLKGGIFLEERTLARYLKASL